MNFLKNMGRIKIPLLNDFNSTIIKKVLIDILTTSTKQQFYDLISDKDKEKKKGNEEKKEEEEIFVLNNLFYIEK